jgi:hypothetical protein
MIIWQQERWAERLPDTNDTRRAFFLGARYVLSEMIGHFSQQWPSKCLELNDRLAAFAATTERTP